VALALLLKRAMHDQPFKKSFVSALSPLALSLIAIYLISFGLYWPMWSDTVSVAGQDNQFKESDLRHIEGAPWTERLSQPFYETIRPFSLASDDMRLRLSDPDFHYSPFDGIAKQADARAGFYVSLASLVVGLTLSWRKFRWQTLTLAIWLVAPFLLQAVGDFILPGAYFRGRFLGFIYFPYLTFMALAWPELGNWLGMRAGNRSPLRDLGQTIGWVGAGALVLLNLAWLAAFYWATINEHWNDMAAYISQHMQANDVVTCGQRPRTACNFDLSVRTRTEVQEFDELITSENLRSNRIWIERPGRVWVVMPHLTPWQVSVIAERVKPGNYWLAGNPRYDQAGWFLMDSSQTLGDNIVAALQLGADVSLNADEKHRNTISLAQVYLVRNQLARAEEALAMAFESVPDDAGARDRLSVVAEELEYARRAAQSTEDIPPAAVRVDLGFEGLARLLAYEIDRHTVSPGESLRINLYWQPLAPIEQSLASFVHLTDRAANLLGQASGIPAQGQAPTTSWKPGQIIVDTYTMQVDASTPTPLVMKVEAGLYDPGNYMFIKSVDGAGQPVSPVLTEMKVIPSSRPSASPTYLADADFGGLISLVGYDLASDPPGVVFYWQAHAAMSEEYTLFVHLVDGEGQLVAQADGPPLQGNYPTSWWSPGEVIVDPRVIPGVAPGTYHLLVGWYRLVDGSRLPLADGSGDSVTLGPFNVP
jgi:hypothetical protein